MIEDLVEDLKSDVEREDERYEEAEVEVEELVYVCERLLELGITAEWLASCLCTQFQRRAYT